MRDLFDLSGKTAVVIGATSVLGSAMAVGLAMYGARIAAVGHTPEKLPHIRSRIEAVGGICGTFVADATQRVEVEHVRDAILAWSGSCDILLNCAGINSATPFLEITDTEWERIWAVNVKTVWLACQIFGAQMIAQRHGGSIINISSVSAKNPLSKVSTYSATKAAVENLTKFLAREWAPHGIRVNAIMPGFFPAEQNRAVLTPERVEAILRQTPQHRFGRPEELQGVAVWLASDAASYVTGAIVAVDGGFTAMAI